MGAETGERGHPGVQGGFRTNDTPFKWLCLSWVLSCSDLFGWPFPAMIKPKKKQWLLGQEFYWHHLSPLHRWPTDRQSPWGLTTCWDSGDFGNQKRKSKLRHIEGGVGRISVTTTEKFKKRSTNLILLTQLTILSNCSVQLTVCGWVVLVV